MAKISKILIANRGEICRRIQSTCRQMGIKTVSIYSENDRYSPHVLEADESYCLGGGALSDTYLNGEAIIGLAKKAQAQAIHPGYGFLSENASFCQEVQKAGLVFIGPSPDVIELMGDKKASKMAMEKLSIPLIPGYHGDDQSPSTLKKEAQKIGLPVLIKASAGGGGKGMRVVDNPEDFGPFLEQAQREAQNAFGNPQVLLEKYIQKPRHIEVQVMSDAHGNHRHFFERECSIQRRHQKIIEESPSVALDCALRKKICEAAVAISRGVNYVGAGTVEFMVDDKSQFYFLEMNTRLQVEHPITEMVTGYDLVKEQILVAEGGKINYLQADITQRGHALECRIYAEDPDNNFLPTTGTIGKVGTGSLIGVRADLGVEDGNEVTIDYDPMLAKLITWANCREDAIAKMLVALDEYCFLGVKTNNDYLKRILKHTQFVDGDIDTHFVTNYQNDLKKASISDQKKAQVLACYYLLGGDKKHLDTARQTPYSAWDTLFNFRNG